MIAVVGTFCIPVASLSAARPLMREVVAATLGEAGCLDYAYAEDVTEPGRFRVFEMWLSREALAAHFEAAHMIRWVAERDALGFCDRVIAVHDIGPASAL